MKFLLTHQILKSQNFSSFFRICSSILKDIAISISGLISSNRQCIFKKKNKTRHLLVTLALRAQTRNLWSPNCLCLKNVVTCGTDHLPMWSRWSDPKCVIGSLRTGVNIRSGRDHTVSSYVHASCLHCQNLNTDRSGGRKSENTEGGNHETPLQSY